MLEERENDPRARTRRIHRPAPASLVSLALHVVLGMVIWKAVQMPAVFDRFLQVDRAARPERERVRFVTVTPPPPSATADTSSGQRMPRQAPRIAPNAPAAVPLVPPDEVPTQLPPVAPPPAAAPGSGAVIGPLRGGSGDTRGVQPAYDDPRVWSNDREFIYAPKTEQERLDSAFIATLLRHQDSVAANAYSPNRFERGDWTFERNGQKYGIDQQFIRLGRLSIPTALLALLPFNRMQTNPIAMERDRNAAYMRADILYHAQAAMNEEEFRKAVRAIRDRKERERMQSQRNSPTNPGPLTSPGERPPPNR